MAWAPPPFPVMTVPWYHTLNWKELLWRVFLVTGSDCVRSLHGFTLSSQPSRKCLTGNGPGTVPVCSPRWPRCWGLCWEAAAGFPYLHRTGVAVTRRGRRADPSGIGSVPLDQTEDLFIQLRALTPAPGTESRSLQGDQRWSRSRTTGRCHSRGIPPPLQFPGLSSHIY